MQSADLSDLDTSNVTDMSFMFSGCNSLTSLDLSGFDTTNVINMGSVFSYCSKLTNLDLSGFNTTNVTNMGSMFYECRSLTNLDISSFDTTNVTNMGSMFFVCELLTNLKLSNFNTKNVTNMSYMFDNCKSLTNLDMSSFDMINVVNTDSMINGINPETIKSPKNLNATIVLPESTDYSWFSEKLDVMYTALPLNQTDSIAIRKVMAITSKEPDVGDGSAEAPYEIDEASELKWFADTVNAGVTAINAVFTADIDMNPGYTFFSDGTFKKEAEGTTFTKWKPIGSTSSKGYGGTFDGQSHAISGLYYNSTSGGNVGLFSVCGTSATIMNVGITDSYFSASSTVGGVCGSNEGIISNCYNEATVVGNYSVGGICGQGTVDNCAVTNCYNTGYVQAKDYFAGGIVGMFTGKAITECYNVGRVESVSQVGGIVGWIQYPAVSTTISNCYNLGTIIASGSYAGGICGKSDYAEAKPIIENCYNAGQIQANSNQGAILGGAGQVTFTNNFYLADSETDSFDGTTHKTEVQFSSGEVAYLLQTNQTEDVWGQIIGQEIYPVLKGAEVYNVENCNNGQYSNATVVGEHYFTEGICHVCGEKPPHVVLNGYTISLNGDIAVNVHMQLSDEVINDNTAYMKFTFADGEETKVFVSDAEFEGEYYIFTCHVQAPEMNDAFTAQLITSVTDMTEKYTYSVKEYADYILAHTTDNADYAKAEPLVRAMLNYGGYSQLQFDHNTNALANEGIYTTETGSDPVLTETVTISDEYSLPVPSEDIGLRYYGSSILLNSETTIRHYFTITGGEDLATIREKYTFVLADGTALTPTLYKGMICVDIRDINAAELDTIFTITVTNESEETISLSYSVFSYAKYVLEYSLARENLVNVIKAMYWYNDAANTYFG